MNNLANNITKICRICLTQGDTMVSYNSKLDGVLEDSPIILDVLENIFSLKIINKDVYPTQVCKMCHGYIKISHDLKLMYNKSQRIIEKYISLWDNADIGDSSTENLDENLHILGLPDCTEEYFSDSLYNLELHSKESNSTAVDSTANLKTAIDSNSINIKKGVEEDSEEDSNINIKLLIENKCVTRSKVNDRQLVSMKNFLSKEKLAEPQTENEEISKTIKSDFCTSKFSSSSKKENHVKIKHMYNAIIECKECNKIFKNNKALYYHNTTQHNTEGKQFICKICGKGFYIKNGLSQHMDIHTRDVSKVICPVCGKGFHYRGGLFYHMKIHRNERNYSCDYCSRKFLNISGLKKHIRTHTGERPYTCAFCGRTFLSKNILDNHEKTHTGIRTKFCPYCNKGFITAYSLKVHISSHAGSLPCNFCKRSFLNSEVLKLHMKFKHNVTNNDNKE